MLLLSGYCYFRAIIIGSLLSSVIIYHYCNHHHIHCTRCSPPLFLLGLKEFHVHPLWLMVGGWQKKDSGATAGLVPGIYSPSVCNVSCLHKSPPHLSPPRTQPCVLFLCPLVLRPVCPAHRRLVHPGRHCKALAAFRRQSYNGSK